VSATYTGKECMAWAGGKSGKHFAAQGNILVSEATVDAMAKAFTDTKGTLGEKLMRALEEGQAAGGDSRGMQSAAILIVRQGGGYAGFNDRYCDLRVDDHPEPIRELRRIFDLWQGQALILEGYTLAEKKEWDRAFAIGAAAIRVHPDEGEPYYHLACYYSKAGRKADALARLTEAVSRDSTLAPRARTDTDFEPLWKDADFIKVVGVAPEK
jgi:tetratricopeptide (TPR) repeat protein